MKKIKINKGFITQKSGKKLTIFDPEASIVYSFNETAAFIFERIKRDSTVGEIIEKVCKKYDVSKDKAQSDVSEFLNTLVKNKIVTRLRNTHRIE